MVERDTTQKKSEEVQFKGFDGIEKRNLFEKSITVAFYTMIGIGGGMIIYALTDPPKQSYEGFKWTAAGAAVGMTTGILVVSFDLDKPFRRKVKHKKKRCQ